MIVIYHKNNKVVSVESKGNNLNFSRKGIVETLFEVANAFPDELLIWCGLDLKSNLNFSAIPEIFHNRKIIASFNLSEKAFFSEAIGYIEVTPFTNIKKEINYPTWQMSSYVGGIYASTLLTFKYLTKSDSFDYFLNSLAKLAMPNGLLCYSEPKILVGISNKIQASQTNLYYLFRFVKQHYKTRWTFLLLLNLFIYERKIAVLPFLLSLFYRKRKFKNNLLAEIEVEFQKKVLKTGTIDVIIPTIGRKEYLYDVLKDLSMQTHLPKNVIIVEQNTNPESVSELDYLTGQKWPFLIKHTFTNQVGACNARNVALSQIESEWVFMADDDIRIENDFIENALKNINRFGVFTGIFGCYANDFPVSKKHTIQMQWTSFGSGCSIVKSEFLEKVKYNSGFEFGYGEDSDFGMQLRNQGIDVIYFPTPEIGHLKAPIGGFRTKPVLAWANDNIQPKPSPTVMLYNQLHLTKEQINGYKTILFFKFYKIQTIKNPIRYYNNFKKQWMQSLYWANKLKSKK